MSVVVTHPTPATHGRGTHLALAVLIWAACAVTFLGAFYGLSRWLGF